MVSRINLQEELKRLCNNVYFKPPSNMSYPAIKYEFSGYSTKKANDNIYLADKRYTVTIIDPNPDSKIPDEFLIKFPKCSFDRAFKSDNLMHWVFTLYY